MKPAPRLETLRGARLAFVYNKKQNNEALVRALSAEVEQRSRGCTAMYWRKPSAYGPLAKKTSKEILESCQAAVLGPGD
jgi:hypothetical protein